MGPICSLGIVACHGDVAACRLVDAPLRAALSHRRPCKAEPGYPNVPVEIGGQAVRRTDMIEGKGEGVVVVPITEAEGLIAHPSRARPRTIHGLRGCRQ